MAKTVMMIGDHIMKQKILALTIRKDRYIAFSTVLSTIVSLRDGKKRSAFGPW
jgi:hypothetical protein